MVDRVVKCLLSAAVVLCGAQASVLAGDPLIPTWYQWPPISGQQSPAIIVQPVEFAAPGQSVTLQISTEAVDQDARYDPVTDALTYPYDTVTYTWSADAGSFPNGSSGPSVTWVAAAPGPTPGLPGVATVTCTINDVPDPIPGGETGYRDDASYSISRRVGVYYGLPDANVNAAGASRTNIKWGDTDASFFYGDDFYVPPSCSGVDGLRVWVVPSVPASPTYHLGDHYSSIQLYVGTAGGSVALLVSGSLTTGSDAITPSPWYKLITATKVSYPGQPGQHYQTFDGQDQQIWQIDLARLGWGTTPGQTSTFGVRLVPRIDRLGFLHAATTAIGDGHIRRFSYDNLLSGSTLVDGCNWFGGKHTDISYQVVWQ